MRLGIDRTTQLLAVLLLAWPAAARADIPDGVLVFEFSGDNEIYDFGSFSDCESASESGLSATLCLDIDMVSDGRGKYTGTASLEFSGDIEGTMMGPASGSVRGKAAGASARLKFKAEGNLLANSLLLDTRLQVSCKGPISPDGFLTTDCRIGVRIAGFGSARAAASYEDELEGGSWTITLDVTPLDTKKFEGTGVDSLGYSYTVKGRYNERKGTSSVQAKGERDTASKGAQVQLKNLTDTGAADARYSVQGYRGKTSVQSE